MNEDDIIAVHEAGHAFMAYLMGKTGVTVQIGDFGSDIIALTKNDKFTAESQETRERNLLITLAGCAAEEMFTKNLCKHGSKDYTQADKLLNTLSGKKTLINYQDEAKEILTSGMQDLVLISQRIQKAPKGKLIESSELLTNLKSDVLRTPP